MKTRTIKIKIQESDINEDDGGITSSFTCPRYEKGIVMIGKINEITFPSGILASKKYDKQIFYHYTCDRCDFKVLIQDENDLAKMTIQNDHNDEKILKKELSLCEIEGHKYVFTPSGKKCIICGLFI